MTAHAPTAHPQPPHYASRPVPALKPGAALSAGPAAPHGRLLAGRQLPRPSARSTCWTTRCCKPLTAQHIKPRLLGHWGTTPGQNFIYVHLNRVINQFDLEHDLHLRPRPRRPRPRRQHLPRRHLLAKSTPTSPRTQPGLKQLFKQFSFPGGIPSHVAPETPGSIHEGGELGYSLSHAFGAVFDNPDLIVACVVGDGEAETGPLATAWHSNKFLNPVTDGAVLPILHLNGYKIANPTVLARIPRERTGRAVPRLRLDALLRRRRRPRPHAPAHGRHARQVIDEIRRIQHRCPQRHA